MSVMKILGIAILIVGVVLLALGIYQFVEFRDSLGGKAASLGNQISRAVGGSSKLAKGYVQPIILMASGVVAGAVGFFVMKRS